MNSQKVTLVSFSPIHRDARLLRQIKYLSPHFTVTVIGYGQLEPPYAHLAQMLTVPDLAERGFARKIRTLILLTLGRILPNWAYKVWYWGRTEHQAAYALLLKSSPSIIHANDWNTLPLAVKVAKQIGAKVILDLHEYAPLEWENSWSWRTLNKPMIDYKLRKYLPEVSATVTVNETIAKRYDQEYGFHPITVMNIPEYSTSATFKPTDANHIRLIHHGGAIRERKLELMIEVLAHTDTRYTLHFMLVEASPGYIAKLKAIAQQVAPDRIFFHQPVPPTEIVNRLTEFDMGIYLLSLTDFNHAMALPNKFFDFITAGLAITVGPSPEMARLTQQFGFGIVAPSFEPIEVAKALNRLTATDIDQMKLKTTETRNTLNADIEMSKLVELYESMRS